MARVPGLYLLVSVISVWFAVSPASAELTVRGWLDYYEGNSSAVSPVISRMLARMYALGMADGLIATKILACPPRYAPDAEALARRVADILRLPDPHPNMSVTVAVLGALDIDGRCAKGPRGKRDDQ